jgi:putative endonuclease
MYFTYILKSEFLPAESYKRFYHGHCENLIERLKRHNSGKVRSTKAYRPWIIHYFEQYSTKSEAYRREMFFKSSEGKEWLKSQKII